MASGQQMEQNILVASSECTLCAV